MRIHMFTDYFAPHFGGGVEQVVLELGRRFVAKGHEVTVFTFNTARAPNREVLDGMKVYRSKVLQLTQFTGLQSSISLHLFSLALRIARKAPPDIIHAHSLFFWSSVVATTERHFLKRPLVTTLHAGSVANLGGLAQRLAGVYEATIGRAILKSSDGVIALSEEISEHAQSLGVPSQKVWIIPNGVDTARFRPTAGRMMDSDVPTVIFVGRLIFNKGPQFVVEAAPYVLQHFPKTRFLMVGDGPLRQSLEARVRELGLEQAFEFLGLRRDIPDILQKADILVRPSLLEGMPLTILEGMACGLPIVATPISGTAELVKHEETGLLVRPSDSIDLADALIRLIRDPELARQMGNRGRALVEAGYSWDAVADRTLNLYNKLLERYIQVDLEDNP